MTKEVLNPSMSTPKKTTKTSVLAGEIQPTSGNKLEQRLAQIDLMVQENHVLLSQLRHDVKIMKRMALLKLVITLVFIVVPLIGAMIIVPQLVSSFTASLGGAAQGQANPIQGVEELLQYYQEGFETPQQ